MCYFTHRIHRPDLLDNSSWVYITTSHVQEQSHYEVNGRTTIAMNLTTLPDPTLPTTRCVCVCVSREVAQQVCLCRICKAVALCALCVDGSVLHSACHPLTSNTHPSTPHLCCNAGMAMRSTTRPSCRTLGCMVTTSTTTPCSR